MHWGSGNIVLYSSQNLEWSSWSCYNSHFSCTILQKFLAVLGQEVFGRGWLSFIVLLLTYIQIRRIKTLFFCNFAKELDIICTKNTEWIPLQQSNFFSRRVPQGIPCTYWGLTLSIPLKQIKRFRLCYILFIWWVLDKPMHPFLLSNWYSAS